ncbi:MAG: restriction endonuclease subunit S [Candidatus Cloacimonetes bacterium]|nr:restriction endonuclease subunit S [Candidatus Cloacimonadota bacterium]
MSYDKWIEYKLSDVCDIKYGKDHKKLSDGIIPTYGSGGIMRYVDSYLYDKPSVLIPRKGTLSNLFYVEKKFWTVDTLFWTKINDSIVYPKFLYYLLLTYKFEDMNVGSAVPSLTTALLNEVKVTLPPQQEQEEIANILSSLDDKIETNNKINQQQKP